MDNSYVWQNAIYLFMSNHFTTNLNQNFLAKLYAIVPPRALWAQIIVNACKSLNQQRINIQRLSYEDQIIRTHNVPHAW